MSSIDFAEMVHTIKVGVVVVLILGALLYRWTRN